MAVTGKQCMQAACVLALLFFSHMMMLSVVYTIHALSDAASRQ